MYNLSANDLNQLLSGTASTASPTGIPNLWFTQCHTLQYISFLKPDVFIMTVLSPVRGSKHSVNLMSSWGPKMSKQRTKNHVFFEVVFSHIRRQICSSTHFTFCSKYMYMQSQCRFIIGVDQFVNGYGVFCRGMRLRGLMLTAHFPLSTEVQYGYSCTSTSPHSLLGILFDSIYNFGRNISDWGDFILRNQLLWTSYFSFCKLCIDAGVGRLKYVTLVDTSIFLHITHIFTSFGGLIFCNFMCHLKYLGSYIFFQETVITFIHFPAFPSELLLIQQ